MCIRCLTCADVVKRVRSQTVFVYVFYVMLTLSLLFKVFDLYMTVGHIGPKSDFTAMVEVLKTFIQ